eukprot:gnl/MRDRNA2_/MRDRNA2_113250_c0_seq1.p1 gnl/MRDRNA2_/MRDRNA2_113250_c0~~gnl/MRDRNA2_/MRDRNA2_113250_c0_seq1.p1  ORF type:complete len:364 (+),score=67.68 gnl/MRDRNA2_/MRDRNA2_113250_c0_seq1:132-1223(+)
MAKRLLWVSLVLSFASAGDVTMYVSDSTEAPFKLVADGLDPIHQWISIKPENGGHSTKYIAIKPSRSGSLPLLVFMHGLTGTFEMYSKNLVDLIVDQQNFIVVFPYVKNPIADAAKFPPVTQTNGEEVIQVLKRMVQIENKNESSVFFNKIDAQNVVIGGHSMGATDAITSSKRLSTGEVGEVQVKLTFAMHPGVCGPFGPPPLPSTWMPSDVQTFNTKWPIIVTTATNDAAFWPQPETAKHERGCFGQVMSSAFASKTAGAIFVEWSKDACAKGDNSYGYDTEGHNCPLKDSDAKYGRPEWKYIIVAMQLYTSNKPGLHDLLWGNTTDSLRNDVDVADGPPLPDGDKGVIIFEKALNQEILV